MNQASLVLIGSTAHSGSTLLGAMLGTGSDCFYVGEAYAWFRPWRRHHLMFHCNSCGSDCESWYLLRNVSPRDFHSTIISKLNKRFVVDSSKNLTWLWDADRWARSKGIDVHHIAVWKDPMELAFSYWKRGRTLNHWKRNFLSYYKRYLNLRFPFISVNYGQLASRPGDVLAQICNFLSWPYFEGKENFWTQDHHYVFSASTLDPFGTDGIRPTAIPPEFEVEWRENGSIDQDVTSVLNRLRERDVLQARNWQDENRKNHWPPPWYFKSRFLIWYKANRMKKMFKEQA